MTGIGTGPEETARADLYRWATIAFTDGVPPIVHDDLTKKLDALVAAVEARTREQVAQEASVLRVRSDASRQVHEAVATRFGLLLPACGIQIRRGQPIADGADVTCPMCNGDEQPMKEKQ